MTKLRRRKLMWAGFLLYTAALYAQDAAVSFVPEEAQGGPKPAATANETADLAKATQNFIASLISVPFQNNSKSNTAPVLHQLQHEERLVSHLRANHHRELEQ
jgi:hypothetical protein